MDPNVYGQNDPGEPTEEVKGGIREETALEDPDKEGTAGKAEYEAEDTDED